MGRRRRDGTDAEKPDRRVLTDKIVRDEKPRDRLARISDMLCPGFVLVIQPSGSKSFKAWHQSGGKLVWHHIGDVRTVPTAVAREQAQKIRLAVALGKDPAAEKKKAELAAATFGELAARYVAEHARHQNKSWRATDALVRRYLLRLWGKRPACEIARSDVRAMMAEMIGTKVLANGVKAAASAIFSWALDRDIIDGDNVCARVKNYPTRSRSRVLRDDELRRLWPHLDPAHKLLLLTGQRPCEVAAMRAVDIVDGVWHLRGEAEGDWPGVKNGEDHSVPLSGLAQAEVEPHLAGKVGPKSSARRLRKIISELGIPRVVPHDFRRSCLTLIARCGHDREARDRIANHRDRSVDATYNHHKYTAENRRIVEDVAAKVMSIIDPSDDDGQR